MTPSPRVVFPQRFHRPTWAEVDLRRLQENLRRLRRRLPPPVGILLVVKGDAYGHGALSVSRAALASGAVDRLGVSSVEEGLALRDAGIRRPILILGSLYPFGSTLAAVRGGLTVTVASLDGARLIAEAAKKAYAPARRFRPLRCHLKLDTGMGRIGVSWPAGLRVAERLRDERGVELEGVYTHLACADADPVFTRLQLERFREALKGLSQAGVRIPLAHAANSAAALLHPASRFDLVRPGLLAYGLFGEGFEPVLSLKTRVVFLKNVRAGTPLSYGALYRTRRPSRIATLPIGYADGLPRLLSIPRQGRPGAAALVRGRRCPIVGAVSMDMTLLDVTGVPDVRVGEEAVLIGRSGSEEVTASELAGWARTIPYEVVTGLKARVPRVYLR
ncbi:MAG TPA: alanine racemase [Elusimicrobia bacterium]|nr:alanine racemase [Elusimicrobiota bacterium]